MAGAETEAEAKAKAEAGAVVECGAEAVAAALPQAAGSGSALAAGSAQAEPEASAETDSNSVGAPLARARKAYPGSLSAERVCQWLTLSFGLSVLALAVAFVAAGLTDFGIEADEL